MIPLVAQNGWNDAGVKDSEGFVPLERVVNH